MKGETITVRGQVQGVGFRPTVWRLATELGLTGDVRNTGDGVEIRLWGAARDRFAERLYAEAPALARIDLIDRAPIDTPAPDTFAIAPSGHGAMRVAVTPDIAVCDDCAAEVRDPTAHRHRYPFANCTNCGPRFSIVRAAPYDRARTTMRDFALCPVCEGEYTDPADRRFHAQPIACATCGPRAWIEMLGADHLGDAALSIGDAVDTAGRLLRAGHILAVKGVGGFNLACDATDAAVVARLRRRKRRYAKAFALMARDLDVVRRYCRVSAEEAALLASPAAPIVILKAAGDRLPAAVSPGLDTFGFMLPYTPLHQLLLRDVTGPVVMTSGNVAGEPQCTDNEEVRIRLAEVADFALMHDRAIANRIDDSVVRIDLGRPRPLRRARGYAPAPILLPDGFGGVTQVLALGGELKNTFCLTKDGRAVLSQHMGDMEDAATVKDVRHNLALYRDLFDHAPEVVAVDRHPDYRSARHGRAMAAEANLRLVEVQHHHAHVAACMAENAWPLNGGRVLGIALDGLGLGTDGTVWGGEFLACDYRGFERLACLKPVALPGGTAAIREPWRNAYAQLSAEIGWAAFEETFRTLDLCARLATMPRATLDAMIAKGVNAPLSSSCGRLFDAAAAMSGVAWEAQAYEGQAAMLFEAAIDRDALDEPAAHAYRFTITCDGPGGIVQIEPATVWRALLGDLRWGTPVGVIAARFHRGLANAIVATALRLGGETSTFQTVALSGGCFQNRTLFTLVHKGLKMHGFKVLTHEQVPANDGGLALGQAVVALATAESG